MSILRRCRGSCRNPRRCLEHLWFDTMHAGERYRIAANDFAVPRMEAGRQRPIESMEEARQWERPFIGEIQAGRDPRLARIRRAATEATPRTENRRVPFNPSGRLAAILKRRSALGPDAFVFGAETGEYQPNIQTAWETLKLLAYDYQPKPGREGVAWNREQLRRIDLRWHDLRHEGACRLLADGVDIRIVQLMLGHASIQQTQRYLNVTDEELRRGLEVSWNNKGRPLRLAAGE